MLSKYPLARRILNTLNEKKNKSKPIFSNEFFFFNSRHSIFTTSNFIALRNNRFLEFQKDSDSKKYVKAFFQNCKDEDIAQFKKSKCMLTLSINTAKHSAGHYLAAELSLVNLNFHACTLILGDTLQRFTMALDEDNSEDFFYKKTRELGDQWIIKNSNLLSALEIPFEIVRWDIFLAHPQFSKRLLLIQKTYLKEPEYQKALDKNIEEYLERIQSKNALKIPLEKAKKLCLNYLQEECAAMLIWVEKNCEFELYPSVRAKALQATYERFIEPLHPNLLKPISLRFKKVTQCFSETEHTLAIEKNEGSKFLIHPKLK